MDIDDINRLQMPRVQGCEPPTLFGKIAESLAKVILGCISEAHPIRDDSSIRITFQCLIFAVHDGVMPHGVYKPCSGSFKYNPVYDVS